MVDSVHRWIIHIILIISTLVGIYTTFFDLFQCGTTFGFQFLLKQIAGKCVGPTAQITTASIHSAVTCISDIVLTGLSVRIMQRSMMPLKQKLSVGGILLLATV